MAGVVVSRSLREIPSPLPLSERARQEIRGVLPLAEGRLLVQTLGVVGVPRTLVEVFRLSDGLSLLQTGWSARTGSIPAAELLYQSRMLAVIVPLVSYAPGTGLSVHPELPALAEMPQWVHDAAGVQEQELPPAPPRPPEPVAPPPELPRSMRSEDYGPGLQVIYGTGGLSGEHQVAFLPGVEAPQCSAEIRTLERLLRGRTVGWTPQVFSWQHLPGRA